VVALLVGLFLFYPRGKSVPRTAEQTAAAPAQAAEPAKQPKKATPQGEVLHQVLPDIPKSAMNTITGTIKISARVEVDPSGKVSAAKLVSAGPSRYFANLVLQAAQRWEFVPPEVAGQPTASTWLLRFRLRRASIQVSPERVTH
jgi:TonB family protein